MARPSASDQSLFDAFDEALALLEKTGDLDDLAAWCERLVKSPLFNGFGYARWSYPAWSRAPDYCVAAGSVAPDALGFDPADESWDDPTPRVCFSPEQSGLAVEIVVLVPGPRRWCGQLRLVLALSEAEWQARPYAWRGRVLLLGHMLQHRIGIWRLEERPVLGRREIQCLALAAEGLKAKQIAVTLGIGQQTVQFHLSRAREKLACGNTVQAVTRAARLGLLPDVAALEVDLPR